MTCKWKMLLVLIWVCCLSCLAGGAEQQEPSGNFTNPSAVKEVVSGERTVANAAWWGFNASDSTKALQSAINSGASKVIVPYMGSDWIVRPIKLTSNQEIVFEPGVVVTAKKGEFKGKYDCLFSARDVNNITLRGYSAMLRMRKSDYQSSKYVKSEWRHSLSLNGCSGIKVFGLTLKDSGGDGIYMGETRADKPCRNVVIRDCTCDNNYRQGMSVLSVENLLVENCVFKNTNGTPPSAGIDIEPGYWTNKLVNIVISNCTSQDNAGSGFSVYLNKLTRRSKDVTILFVDCYVSRCVKPGLIVGAVNDNGPKGLIEFKNCTVEDLNPPGLYIFDKSPDSAVLRFSNCNWANTAKKETTTFLDNNVMSSPIHFFLKRENLAQRFGGVEFVDCSVYDDENRPFLTATERGKGLSDIKGNINVYNRFGPKMELGEKTRSIGLEVNNRYK